MEPPVNLLELGKDGVKKFLDSFDHVFSDCDGVIWTETPLPGASDFFNFMKENGKTVNFVSNNSLRSRANYEAHFKAAGIDNGFVNLTIPSLAIAEYLKSMKFEKTVYCATCPETVSVLEANGFKCKTGPTVCPELFTDFVQFLEDDEEIGAVVFDSDYMINLPKMYRAITYLKRPDVLFINGATDRVVPIKPGCLAIGTGQFADIVIENTGRRPIQLGKPGKSFGEFAMKRAGVTDPSRVLFIGDMIEQDIGLGRAVGFKTLLVLTNSTVEKMLAHKTIQPDYYADSLGAMAKFLNNIFD